VRRVLHGVRIAVEPGLSADLCRALLDALPPDGADGPPDVSISVRASEHRVRHDAAGRPILFHGLLHGREVGGAVRLTDGASAVEISCDGRAITGLVHAPAGDERPFDHVLLVVALAVALRSHGLYHVHAALLVAPDGATVLVPGSGGAGKTTLALALASRGFSPRGDDVCFLTRRGGAPAVVPVPRTFHVAERTARAFPGLARHLGAPVPSGKRELDLRRALPGPRSSALPLPSALLFPSVAGAPRTVVSPRSPEAAFEGLLDSSALAMVDAMPGAKEHVALLGEVVRGGRALDVILGEDLLADPARVAGAVAAALAAAVG
jgi:hypothetical protein